MNTLHEEIKAAFPAMTASQQKVAHYVDRDPDELAFLTLDVLAARARVSTSTVLRFARSLGYTGYSDLQARLREKVRSEAGLPQRFRLSDDGTAAHIYARTFERDVANLQTTMRLLPESLMDEVVDAIISARRVYFFGSRVTYSLAHFASSVLSSILPSVRLLSTEAGMLPDQVARMGEGDVLIAFSFPAYVRTTFEVAAQAKEFGVKLVAICDSSLAPIAKNADFVLPCEFEGVVYTSSLVAPLSLINSLTAAVVVRSNQQSLHAISEVDSLLDKWKYFLV